MASYAYAGNSPSSSKVRLDHRIHPGGVIAFGVVLLAGLAYAGVSVVLDTQQVGEQLALGAFAFLGLALLIALGFEFVNGFHDTANAVATVIYTNSLAPVDAVVWSGVFNFLGVMVSTRGGGLFDHHAAAGRPDPACRQRGRLCDDLRAAVRGGAVEPRHLVCRPAQFLEPRADRVDPRRRPRQPAPGGGPGGTSGVDWARRRRC